MSDWGNDVSRAYQLYSGERDYDYGAAQDNRKYDYETAMGMIGMGLMPDDQMLSNAGISREAAQKMVDSYLAQQAAALAASSGGGGGGRRGSGGGGSSKSSAAKTNGVDDQMYKKYPRYRRADGALQRESSGRPEAAAVRESAQRRSA